MNTLEVVKGPKLGDIVRNIYQNRRIAEESLLQSRLDYWKKRIPGIVKEKVDAAVALLQNEEEFREFAQQATKSRYPSLLVEVVIQRATNEDITLSENGKLTDLIYETEELKNLESYLNDQGLKYSTSLECRRLDKRTVALIFQLSLIM